MNFINKLKIMKNQKEIKHNVIKCVNSKIGDTGKTKTMKKKREKHNFKR